MALKHSEQFHFHSSSTSCKQVPMAPKEAAAGGGAGPPGPPGGDDDHMEPAENEPAQNGGPEVDLSWLAGQLEPLMARQGVSMEQLMQALTGNADEEEDDWAWEDTYGGKLTQLLEASTQGNLAAVMQLVQEHQGSKQFLDAPGRDGDTSLHLASLYGNEQVVAALLQAGANPAIVNQHDGSTAHHDAAASGHKGILQMLIQAAPQMVHTGDEDGDTPLHNAARGNHLELVQLLLQAGADKSKVNGSGNTPADEADDAPVKALLQ